MPLDPAGRLNCLAWRPPPEHLRFPGLVPAHSRPRFPAMAAQNPAHGHCWLLPVLQRLAEPEHVDFRKLPDPFAGIPPASAYAPHRAPLAYRQSHPVMTPAKQND